MSIFTRDEARRIAANIAKLPELLRPAVGHQKLPAAFSGPALRTVRDDKGQRAADKDEARRVAANIATLPFSRRKACAKLLEL